MAELEKVTVLRDEGGFLFALKAPGVLSEDDGGEDNMVSLLSRAASCGVFPVHRLDRAVGGVMVFAKTKSVAAYLSGVPFEKEYLAVVHGDPGEGGEMTDLLFKDSRANKSYVVKRMRRGVREAKLSYRRIAERNGFSLVSVKLFTGRSHQIRVQFSSRRHPLVGDGKYGASDGCPIALFSSRICVTCRDGGKIGATCLPDAESYPWSCFSEELSSLYANDVISKGIE